MAARILLVTHEPAASPGRVDEALHTRGHATVRCRTFASDVLPDARDFDGVVVFGGHMSANDEHLDFIRAELQWIPTLLAHGTPYLGICLGAQLLARALGAPVTRHRDGLYEIGFARIEPTEAGADTFVQPMHVYHWHGEGFAIAQGATRLATGDIFENQAFRYGNAVGVQFHPEVTPAIITRWVRDKHDLRLPGAQPRETHLAAADLHGPEVERWLDGFLERWLRRGRPDAAAA